MPCPEQPVPSEGLGNPLQYIMDAIGVVRDLFFTTSDAIKEVYLLGEWLSTPFATVALWLDTLWSAVEIFGSYIAFILFWVEAIIYGDGLGYLLCVIWSGFYELIDDPLNFILEWIYSVYDWIYDFLDDPIGFISSLVSFILSEIEEFIADPLGYIESVVRYIFPLLEFFWDDPIGFILEQLAFLYSWLYDFLIDPLAFILQLIGYEISHWYDFLYFPVDWIISLLGEFSNEVYEFLQDPFGYVYSIVQSLLGDITFDPFEIGLALLEQLIQIAIDNLLWVIDSLEELIVEFIVERL